MIRCYYPPPNNLIDPPLPSYRKKNATALQSQKLMHGKSNSEHNFSGVGCNFRFSRVFFQGKQNPGFFKSLLGLPGFVGHPEYPTKDILVVYLFTSSPVTGLEF